MTDFSPIATTKDEILNFLLSTPTPQDIANFKLSDTAQARLQYLVDGNREGTLSSDEAIELEHATNFNRFMTILKATAHKVITE